MKKLTKTLAMVKVLRAHRGMYRYDWRTFKGSRFPISIYCKTHGVFPQRVDAHISGQGCPRCGDIKTSNAKRINPEIFWKKVKKVHQSTYIYPTPYEKMDDTLTITCKTHGDFTQKASAHYLGHGCQKCADLVRRNTHEHLDGHPTILYYIKIKELYKIGITAEHIGVAIRHSDIEYTLIQQVLFKTRLEAKSMEQRILEKYQHLRYQGPNVINGGNSELFIRDVLCTN